MTLRSQLDLCVLPFSLPSHPSPVLSFVFEMLSVFPGRKTIPLPLQETPALLASLYLHLSVVGCSLMSLCQHHPLPSAAPAPARAFEWRARLLELAAKSLRCNS